ncbi:MAG: TonB-dependent receptor [Prevotellaceae bacterium]|jgi:outer membrane cobalamin receptor|nr:TonB-dependent receptor [Prevotellaceae bacterium]
MKRLAALTIMTLALCTAAVAQDMIKGTVVDAKTKEALTGAMVVATKANRMAIADQSGAFQLKVPAGSQELTVSFLGYKEKIVPVTVVGDVGVIEMEPDAFGLDEVVITAGIVVRDRATPVAVSNIPLEQIEMKLGNQEFPEILKSTPSIYATKQGGGYGDSRVNLRGFNSENVGVLINGVPINDMEGGRVYWSNWAGLSDVTTFMQVQRGLGASKLGLSSVGGTINIITKSSDAEAGGSVYYGMGNDGLQKLNMNVSTGLMDNGWAATLAGGHAVADGYVLGTDYEAWNYFVNITKVINAKHRLSFTAFGAPQWHNQRGTMYTIQDFRDSKDGARMNRSYGYVNDKVVGGSYAHNEYHKPQISLAHYWNINEKSALSTSVYASIAKGGGRRAIGQSNWLSINNNTGKPYDDTKLTADGLLDYDEVYRLNGESVNGSRVVFANAVNSHDWYGILSSYNNQLTSEIKFTAGFDGRYYRGYHRNEITDLLGGEYYIENNIYGRPANTPLHEGDVIGYDEMGEVLWTGLFAQGEYVKDAFSAFLSGSVSGNFYRWYNWGEKPVDGKQKSEWVTFLPFSVKGGANYKFLDNHNVFANGGYFTRAPFFNSAFVNYTIETNPDAKSEKVYTGELGYGFEDNHLNVTLTGYYTVWLDKGLTRTTNGTTYNILGINARHMGLELEATYRPVSNFNVKGMLSIGDWIWKDDVNFTAYDENQVLLDRFDAFIANVHVGNSAQITGALAANWTPVKNIKFSADFNWFGKNFANFEPTNRTQLQDKVDAWQMPDYYTVDLSASYKFKIGGVSATLYGSANNLLDAEYITDAKDGTLHNAETALVYYGFGRTWTTGLRINF